VAWAAWTCKSSRAVGLMAVREVVFIEGLRSRSQAFFLDCGGFLSR
jgi:hypothetical protein